jgi:hypothetical protein
VVERRIVLLAAVGLTLSACQSVQLGSEKPDGSLKKAEIDACLASEHRVGDEVVSPHPRPHRVFKPGYNFTVKQADGTYGFGYEEASDGHLLVKYPEHGTSFDYGVARTNGVVYFGSKRTSCN